MEQISYTPETPPTKGNAKKIWDTLVANGYKVDELHYNKGPRSACGSGTWACETYIEGAPVIDNKWGYWCGIIGKTAVYLEQTTVPYGQIFVGFATRKCPFRNKNGCSFMHNHTDWPWDKGMCNSNCDTLTDEQLLKLANEYEKVKE